MRKSKNIRSKKICEKITLNCLWKNFGVLPHRFVKKNVGSNSFRAHKLEKNKRRTNKKLQQKLVIIH